MSTQIDITVCTEEAIYTGHTRRSLALAEEIKQTRQKSGKILTPDWLEPKSGKILAPDWLENSIKRGPETTVRQTEESQQQRHSEKSG